MGLCPAICSLRVPRQLDSVLLIRVPGSEGQLEALCSDEGSRWPVQKEVWVRLPG